MIQIISGTIRSTSSSWLFILSYSLDLRRKNSLLRSYKKIVDYLHLPFIARLQIQTEKDCDPDSLNYQLPTTCRTNISASSTPENYTGNNPPHCHRLSCITKAPPASTSLVKYGWGIIPSRSAMGLIGKVSTTQ